MLNQQEERPLSIGSAVQFTHKGDTIHGHLLQQQGRCRFAKVIDAEERIWKVPESALKHSGEARHEVVTIDEVVKEIRDAVQAEDNLAKRAIPEQFPLLRTIQLRSPGY